jgi:hypothetical protein
MKGHAFFGPLESFGDFIDVTLERLEVLLPQPDYIPIRLDYPSSFIQLLIEYFFILL